MTRKNTGFAMRVASAASRPVSGGAKPTLFAARARVREPDGRAPCHAPGTAAQRII